MSDFEDRRHFGWEVELRKSALVTHAIQWCRDNIPPRYEGIIASASLLSSENEGRTTGHCWTSIYEHNTQELFKCLTLQSLDLYNKGPLKNRHAAFAFYNLEDSIMFDVRWR